MEPPPLCCKGTQSMALTAPGIAGLVPSEEAGLNMHFQGL